VGEDTQNANLVSEYVQDGELVSLNKRDLSLKGVPVEPFWTRSGSLKSPSDDVQTNGLGSFGVVGLLDHELVGRVEVRLNKAIHGRGNDVDTVGHKVSEPVLDFSISTVANPVKGNSLGTIGSVLDPLNGVCIVKGLRPDVGRWDDCSNIFVNHGLGVHLLGEGALVRHGDTSFLQFRSELSSIGLDKLNVFGMSRDSRALVW
jgi:hypothetical protein